MVSSAQRVPGHKVSQPRHCHDIADTGAIEPLTLVGVHA